MIEDFLQRFSYWPRSLAESFGDLLGLALPQSPIYDKARLFYTNNAQSSVSLESESIEWMQGYPTLMINFLQPMNQQYRRILSEQKGYFYIPIDMAQKSLINEWVPFNGMIISGGARSCIPTVSTEYDSRLFSNVSNDYNYIFTPIGESWKEHAGVDIAVVSWGKTRAIISARATVSKFSGVNSILALHENGKSFPDVAMQNLYEFKTYLDAYEKNLSQIAATVNNSEAAARDELTRYSRELQTQIDNEQRNLENLAITLQNQTQAESFEVSRDIANLILTAQGVALQISERLP